MDSEYKINSSILASFNNDKVDGFPDKELKKVSLRSLEQQKANQLNNGSFANKQLDLFQGFFANTELQKRAASNLIELWDSVPRYSVSQIAMNKMRDERGRLDLLEIQFDYRQTNLKVIIQPALIKEVINGIERTYSYYPSANEELIEEALRKIAATQQKGFHEPGKRSGVLFTIYELREELKIRGHARTYNEIVKSLNILSSSIITVIGLDNKLNKNVGKKSAFFPNVTWVTKDDLLDDPNAKWHVEFHPMVTNSIDDLSFRQYNYQQLMSYRTQLARYLHKYLFDRYVMASKLHQFKMNYSTIKRNSAMLDNYKFERQAIAAFDYSMNELIEQKLAHKIERQTLIGYRNKIIDVVYSITPTLGFIAEVKAANARQKNQKT